MAHHGPSGSLVPPTGHSQVEPARLCAASVPNSYMQWKVAHRVVGCHMGYLEIRGPSRLAWICLAASPVLLISIPDRHLSSCHYSPWGLPLRTASAGRALPKSGPKIYNQSRVTHFSVLNNLIRQIKVEKVQQLCTESYVNKWKINKDWSHPVSRKPVPRGTKEATNADCFLITI